MSGRFVLFGPNEVDRQERVAQIIADNDPSELATSRIDARASSAAEVRQAVLSPPFFGGHRVVVIDHLFGAASSPGSRDVAGSGASSIKWTDVRDYLFESPESTIVVINGFSGPPGSTSGQLRRRGWEVAQFPELRGRTLISWIVDRGDTRGVAFDREAAMELAGRLFPTLWQREPTNYDEGFVDTRALMTEIEKLALAASDGQVTVADVRELVAERPGLTAFRLGDAVFGGQTDAALDELAQSLASDEAPEKLLGQLAHQLAALQAARMARRHDVDAAAEASGLSPGLISVTVNRKRAWQYPAALRVAAEQLREAEWRVRTGRASSPEETIVPAVTAISEEFRNAAARREAD